ncbi:hypothetical protein EBR43_06910 [bacterium]|nr:hypothetical protein [bacterium]
MNKNKLSLLLALAKELQMHMQIKLDMSKQAGGTVGHKWGCRIAACKKFQKLVKILLIDSLESL